MTIEAGCSRDTDDDMWDQGYDDGFNLDEPTSDEQPYVSGYRAGRQARKDIRRDSELTPFLE